MTRVLVIDDDDQVRETLKEVLKRAGYEVKGARDGMEGMRLFRNEGADLVIADIIMPEKDGLETIRELREGFPEAKILAISGGGDVDPRFYLHCARELGALRTLAKPFGRKELLDTVDEMLL